MQPLLLWKRKRLLLKCDPWWFDGFISKLLFGLRFYLRSKQAVVRTFWASVFYENGKRPSPLVVFYMLTLSWTAGHICPTYKEPFQVRWDKGIPLFLHVAIYHEVSLFRWTIQNAFSRETAVLYKWYCVQCCMQHCTQALQHTQYHI